MIEVKVVEEMKKDYLILKFQANKLLKFHSPLIGGIEGVIMRSFIRKENHKYLPYNISKKENE